MLLAVQRSVLNRIAARFTIVICLITLDSFARADAPKGRYRLDVRRRLEPHGGAGELPSCGPRATDFIANIGRLGINYSDEVKINNVTWKIVSVEKDQVEVVRDDILKDLYVKVAFWRNRDKGAIGNGILAVIGVGPSGAQCADTVKLEGTFTR